MEIRASNNLIDAMIAQRMGVSVSVPSARANGTLAPAAAAPRAEPISLSRDLVAVATSPTASANQTRLLRESIEPIERGFRRTQTFERADGRTFTRVEEFTAVERNARRTVIQQNASGNTTRFDEVLERQDNGTFRRTQRFTDEAGETSTQIDTAYVSVDPFILSCGVRGGFGLVATQGTGALRGTQLDLQA